MASVGLRRGITACRSANGVEQLVDLLTGVQEAGLAAVGQLVFREIEKRQPAKEQLAKHHPLAEAGLQAKAQPAGENAK